jgi:hypothetical protein
MGWFVLVSTAANKRYNLYLIMLAENVTWKKCSWNDFLIYLNRNRASFKS